MIFATVGTQLPFDRMMRLLENWAIKSGVRVFCQTGPTSVEFRQCENQEFISPKKYIELLSSCELVVAHAGIGSILSAMEYQKPIIIFPRKASLGEHRNEHQLATAKQFKNKQGIYVAFTDDELLKLLDSYKALDTGELLSPHADQSLISAIQSFIQNC